MSIAKLTQQCERLRLRYERDSKARKSTAISHRDFVVCKAKLIRAELREERKHARAS